MHKQISAYPRVQQRVTHQSGAVLLIGLILLVGITLLSVAGMQTAVLNERMASNAQQIEQGNQLAESAGIVGIANTAWVNAALMYLETHPDPALDMSPPNENKYDLGALSTASQDIQVSVGLLARDVVLPGISAGMDSDITCRVVEVHGSARLSTVTENKIVQGFKKCGAGSNG